MPDHCCIEVQSDRFGKSSRSWDGQGLLLDLEYGLRSLGNVASKVLGSFSNRLSGGASLGPVLALETKWHKCGSCGNAASCHHPGGVGSAGWVWGCAAGVGRTVQPPFVSCCRWLTVGACPRWFRWETPLSSPSAFGLTEPLALLTLKLHFLFPQPGKLTEAFKYFVQGMGYSKWQTQFSGLEQGCCEGNSAFLVHLSPLASVFPPISVVARRSIHSGKSTRVLTSLSKLMLSLTCLIHTAAGVVTPF